MRGLGPIRTAARAHAPPKRRRLLRRGGHLSTTANETSQDLDAIDRTRKQWDTVAMSADQ